MDYIPQHKEAGQFNLRGIGGGRTRNGGLQIQRNKFEGFTSRARIGALIGLALLVALAGTYGLLRPTPNGCTMTYMYPTYIPVPAPKNLSSSRYALHLYHEGWKKIDFNEHLKNINGIPVLFIPGSSGSYKQVRSIAKESHWAYTTGPLERTFYQEASLAQQKGGFNLSASVSLPNQYIRNLDWFAVDLEGEHSAMDGRILEEHTEFVVYCIHRILDQYKESYEARAREGAAGSVNLPKSVILLGHSVGGFVARAAVVHPHLRKSAVETIVSLSSPHQSPPVALQPSIGWYYASINQKWREGYQAQVSRAGKHIMDPVLSNVVVISISGGINDYQVRTKLESLDGIVPPSHGFMISSTSMKNVWLSMEHQSILWCNQLIVQVSHTLLSLLDPKTSQPFDDSQRRLAVFAKMLQNGVAPNFNWMKQSLPSPEVSDDGETSKVSLVQPEFVCPKNVQWGDDGLEKDLYIKTKTVTVLAMDGRRRWLDIQKLGTNGTSHFVLVTNLPPCYGVRIHLWSEKGRISPDMTESKGNIEMTSKMVHIPSGPTPKQIEPGSQTEQPPPSGMFWLSPEDMKGYRFITISVAPRPTISGRPPPSASMAVGQFFNPKDGNLELSPASLLQSAYSQQSMEFQEDHPLAVNISSSISLGLLPVTLSLKMTGCGIKNSGEAGDAEKKGLCKLRCFPPVALAWDSLSGLHVYPNLQSETVVVDSAPALWTSTQGSEKTTVLLLIDPHCAFQISYSVSSTGSASRFLLLYCAKIAGLAIAAVFFALMRQARAWELGLPVPSLLMAVEYNMRFPLQFLITAVAPLLIALLLSLLMAWPLPAAGNFLVVSLSCYMVANGFVVILISISKLVLYIAAGVHVFIMKRWQIWKTNFCFAFIQWFINLSSSFFLLKVVNILRLNPLLVTALAATLVVCLVHPALGLSILLLFHVICCHNALCSYLSASFRSLTQKKESLGSRSNEMDAAEQYALHRDGGIKNPSSSEQNGSNCPEPANSFSDMQLEIFYHRHGLLILHFLAAMMFGPSLLAWFQRLGSGQYFPWLLDSILCIGIILHGICDPKPEFSFFSSSLPCIPQTKVRLSFLYMLAGYFSFLTGLALAPYRAVYAMATIGVISFIMRVIQRKNREKGEAYFTSRKHSHRN
ncbi:hypothetical protein V2J09_003356 [Rumex salicifolius]